MGVLTVQEQKETLKILKPLSVKAVLVKVSRMLDEHESSRTALEQIGVDWASDPFKVLIGTILSHRTKDEMTAKATKNLFQRFKGIEDLAVADEEEVRSLIRLTGFYRVKAKSIIEVARMIKERFNGIVPNDMESLLSLPAVGRKTANCVLVYGFNTPAIPVDTHVHRISNRLNLVQTRTPEETEIILAKKLSRNYWLYINSLFIRFGKTICRPIKPKCEDCILCKQCAYHALKVATPQ